MAKLYMYCYQAEFINLVLCYINFLTSQEINVIIKIVEV